MQAAAFNRLNHKIGKISPREVWTSCPGLLWLALLSLWPVAAQSQSPGAIDPTFNAGVIDGAVRGIVVQSNSTIVAIGDFSQIGGANRQHVVRLNSDGSVDQSFVPAPELWVSPSNRVTHLAVQRNGSVLLGGRFELQYPGAETNTTAYVVRLTSAGSLDWSFGPVTIEPLLPAPASEPSSGTLLAMALQADDKAIIGYHGCSSSIAISGQVICSSASVIRRLSPDGQTDSTFKATISTMDGVVLWSAPRQICLELSGTSLTVWDLLINGSLQPSVQRLDSQGIHLFSFGFGWITGGGLGPGWASIVDAIGSAEDGSVWVGGFFAIDGKTMSLARMAAHGSWDPTVQSPTQEIFGILPLPGRRVLVSTASGQMRALQRLDSRGQIDPAWPPTTFPKTTLTMAQQPDGKVLVAGSFSVGARQNLVRLCCDNRSPRAPVILQAPVSQTLDSTNQPVTLFVRAEGYPYPSYQWYKDGLQLPGQTNDTVIAPIQFASYYVVVSNPLGSATSPEIQISVRRIPTLAEALNTPDWQYTATGQWQVVTGAASHDGVAAVSGTTPKIFTAGYGPGDLKTTVQGPGTLSFWIKGDRGEFYVGGDRWGMTRNNSAWEFHRYVLPPGIWALRWSVQQPYNNVTAPGTISLDEVEFRPMQPGGIRIITQPTPRAAPQAGAAVFQVQAESQLPLHYQWFYSAQDQFAGQLVMLGGATNASLVLAPATRSEAGLYRVAVTNELGAVMSEPALLEVSPTLDWTHAIPFYQPTLASPDGQWLVGPLYYSQTGADWFYVAEAWNLQTVEGKYLLQLPLAFQTYPAIPLAISPDSSTLAVGLPSGTIQFRSLASGTQVGVLTNGVESLAALAFSPTGQLLAVGTTDAVVRVWRIADGGLNQVLSWRQRPGPLSALTFSPDGAFLAADRGHRVVVWNLADGSGREPDPDWDAQGWIGYSPDGTLLASRTQIRSTADWQERYRFTPGLNTAPLAFSPDGRMLLFGGREGARILWIEPGPRFRLLEDYRYWGLKTFLAFSQDGTRFILDATPQLSFMAVEPAPVLPGLISSFDHSSQMLWVRVEAMTNSAYSLQVSPDLQHWQDWTNGVVNGTSVVQQSHVETKRRAQFYRARLD